MRTTSLFFLLMLFLTLWSCESKNKNNDIIIDVNDDFSLRFLENLSTPEDDLFLRLESINDKNCVSDTVLMELNNFGNAININVNVMNTEMPCDLGGGKAKTEITSGALSLSRYPLSIRLEELLSNPGDLLIDETSYQFKMQTTYGFYLPYENLQKIPQSTLWGYVAYTPLFEEKAIRFLERLLPMSEDINLSEGQYGYFEITSDNDIIIPEAKAEQFLTASFVRKFNLADVAQIEALMAEFQGQNPGMRFFLWDSFGKVY